MKTITVADIAKSIKVSPKVARAKLRRAGVKHGKDGWTFPMSKRASLVATLKA